MTLSIHWGERRDSNPRPSGPQPDALTTELRSPCLMYLTKQSYQLAQKTQIKNPPRLGEGSCIDLGIPTP